MCCARLESAGPDEQHCPIDGAIYRRVDGIWRFLTLDRAAHYQQFIREYETVRRAEGWGSADDAYYRALPLEDRAGRLREVWRIRADNFGVFINRVVMPIERQRMRPLKIIDLGAGNGWLSYRLTQRGHEAAAVDVLINAQDGLGAHVHYDVEFTPVQAEFDHLPFDAAQADLAVFNGSVHYSPCYETALREALRVILPHGRLVILDSPYFRDAASGDEMVRQREARFEREFSFRSDALASENYLTPARLSRLASALKVHWQILWPPHPTGWMLRRWKARIVQRREPASFPVIVGRRIS
jgi:SAM-dependent methyltransferase